MRPSLRRSLVLSLAVLALPAYAQGEDAPTDSTITQVVVYPQSAEVTRERQVDVQVGLNEFVFGGLVACLDPSSLRASSDDGVDVVGIETRTRFLTEPLSRQLAELDIRIRAQSGRVKEVEWELERIEEERAFYATIRTASLKTIQEAAEGKSLSVEEWEKVMKFVREGTEFADRRRLEVEERHRKENEALGALQNERTRIASERPREMKEVAVTLRADRAGRVTVRVHYVVTDAGWTPTYDVHLYRADSRVRFTCYGLVTQATGEGWEGVRLTLARARAEHRIDAPETRPVVVSMGGAKLAQLTQDIRDLNQAADSKLWFEARFGSDATSTGNFYLNVNELAMQTESFLADNGITRVELVQAMQKLQDRFSSVRYAVQKPETILSDRSAHKVVVFSELLPAKLRYVALPSANALVIRKAELENSTSFPFLAGPSSVFVDGSYVGASKVPNASANESVSLFFGPDDAIKVTRELVKRESKGPERFRQSQLVTYEFQIRVENFQASEVEVDVEDQIPISQTDDVQIRFLGSSVEGVQPDAKGILTFPLRVAARAAVTVTFRYQIEHPLEQSLLFE